jgi:hypothetical protein
MNYVDNEKKLTQEEFKKCLPHNPYIAKIFEYLDKKGALFNPWSFDKIKDTPDKIGEEVLGNNTYHLLRKSTME